MMAMDSNTWIELQEAIVYVFGPVIAWLFAMLAAGGFFAGVAILWLSLLRYLSRR